MSPSDSITTTQALTTSPERTEPVTRAEVIDRIVTECTAAGIDCGTARAGRLIDLYDKAATYIRSHDGRPYLPSTVEMRDLHNNGIMDAITPDTVAGAIPDVPVGSAYAGINALVCRGDEFAMVHTKVYDHGTHCALVMAMRLI